MRVRSATLMLPFCLALAFGCDGSSEARDSGASSVPRINPAPLTEEEPQAPKAQDNFGAGQTIEFLRSGARMKDVSVAELVRDLGSITVTSKDPYYKEERRYSCLRVGKILENVFGSQPSELRGEEVALEAADGYRVKLPADTLLSPHACFAFADADRPKFEPISERKADPGPLYLVWKGDRGDTHKYPRPWGIVRIELDPKSDGDERLSPEGGFGANQAAERGFKKFSDFCVRCHSINQTGGKVGPDLNVPQNILAYRPEAQVKAYIKNPEAFRYSIMPPNPDLTDAELNDLIAYLHVMGQHQVDPRATKETPAP